MVASDSIGGHTFPSCVRCKESITSGHAYELGDDRWHTHCFSCYRCDKPLSCDSDFLVLGTGTLICFDCSDSCKSCGKKIGDLAIILSSSNESYCSDCFKCCKCGDQIKDLRYAKTKRGLFCIHCHEKLLAKRKRYEEKKRRLKKTLPEIPPATLDEESKTPKDLSQPIVIPEKSNRRPLSPKRDHQTGQTSQSSHDTHMRTNSESVISQYLANDSDEIEEDSETSGNGDADYKNDEATSTNGVKHERNVSIDDILNSTLENDGGNGTESINSVQLSVKKVENARTLLNKTPLRNGHRRDGSFSRSPLGNRKGMVMEDDDSECDSRNPLEHLSETSIDEVRNTLTTAINTPTAIQVVSPERKAQEVFSGLDQNNSKKSNGSTETNSQEPINEIYEEEVSSQEDHLRAAQNMQEKRQGLALNISSNIIQSLSSAREEDTLTLGIDSNTLRTITSPSTSHRQPNSSPEIALKNGVDVPTGSTHSKSSSEMSGNAYIQSTNSTVSTGSRSIGRSLSMKSKNLVNNLKSKTSGILDPKSASSSYGRSNGRNSPISTPPSSASFSPKMDSFDTHSGWGVPSIHERDSRRGSPSLSTRRFNSGARSDGTTQFDKKIISSSSNMDAVSHQRSRSNVSVNSGVNISMYRTPPLESTPAFSRGSLSEAGSHLRNTSWQANNLPVSKEENDESVNIDSENENFMKKELAETELYLRKLKLELGELESKKSHLKSEVDSLQMNKDSLTREIGLLRSQKENFTSSESLEQISHIPEVLESQKMQVSNSDSTSPAKQLSTASVARPAAKPRFWKIFSGGKQLTGPASQGQQHHSQSSNTQSTNGGYNTSLSSSSSNPTSGKRIDISAPVLQNPNEFSDMKLLPIVNKSFSSTSSQASPSKQDGTSLYGSQLVARCSYEQTLVPKLLLECVDQIESDEELMRTEGIYRKSGSQLLIDQIEREFIACDANISPELGNLLKEDVHAVASVLKRYLRKLPNPVLSFQIYEPLMSTVRENSLMTDLPLNKGAIQNSNNTLYRPAIESVRNILDLLPTEHYESMKFLAQHIHKITTFSESNLMNLYNLSLVFAPGLIRDYNGEKDIMDMKERNYIIGFIVGNYTEIFQTI